MNRRAKRLPKEATWRSCSGAALRDARGTGGLCKGSPRRPPGGLAVGPLSRLSMGQVYVRMGCPRRLPRGAAMGPLARLSLGWTDMC